MVESIARGPVKGLAIEKMISICFGDLRGKQD
jgi:hypothetical protein